MSDIEKFVVLFENEESMEIYIKQQIERSHNSIDLAVWGLQLILPVHHRNKALTLFFNQVFEDVKTKHTFITDLAMLKGITYDKLNIPNECGIIKGIFLNKFQPFKKKLIKIAETRRIMEKTRMSRKCQYLSDPFTHNDHYDPYIFTGRDVSPLKWIPKPSFKFLETTKNVHHPDFKSSLQNRRSLPTTWYQNHFKEKAITFEEEFEINKTDRKYSNMSKIDMNNNVQTNGLSFARKKSKSLSKFIHLMRNRAEKEFHTEKITKREKIKLEVIKDNKPVRQKSLNSTIQPKNNPLILSEPKIRLNSTIQPKINPIILSEPKEKLSEMLFHNEISRIPQGEDSEIYMQTKTSIIQTTTSQIKNKEEDLEKNDAINNVVFNNECTKLISLENSIKEHSQKRNSDDNNCVDSEIREEVLIMEISQADENNIKFGKKLDTIPRIKKRKLFSPNSVDLSEFKRLNKNEEKNKLRKLQMESIVQRKIDKRENIKNRQIIENLQETSEENNLVTEGEFCNFEMDRKNIAQNEEVRPEIYNKCVQESLETSSIVEEHNMDTDGHSDDWEEDSHISLDRLSTISSDNSSQKYVIELETTARTLETNIKQIEGLGINEAEPEKEDSSDTPTFNGTERNEEIQNSEQTFQGELDDSEDITFDKQKINRKSNDITEEINSYEIVDLEKEKNLENVQDFSTYSELHEINQRSQENFQIFTPNNDLKKMNHSSQKNDQIFIPNNYLNGISRISQDNIRVFTPNTDLHKMNYRSQEHVQVFTPNNDLNYINSISQENIKIFTPTNDLNKMNPRSQENVQFFTPTNYSNKMNRRNDENVQVYKPNNDLNDINSINQENIQVFKQNNDLNKINRRSQENVQVFTTNNDLNRINRRSQENVQVFTTNNDMNNIIRRSQENVQVFTTHNDLNKINCRSQEISEAAIESDHDINDDSDSFQPGQFMLKKQFTDMIENSIMSRSQMSKEELIKGALQKEFMKARVQKNGTKEVIQELREFDLFDEKSISMDFSQKQQNTQTRSNIIPRGPQNRKMQITPSQPSRKIKTPKNSSDSDKSKESFANNVIKILQKQNYDQKELSNVVQNLRLIKLSTNISPTTDDSDNDLDLSDLEIDSKKQLNLTSNSELSPLDTTISDEDSSTLRSIKFRTFSNDFEVLESTKTDTTIDNNGFKYDLFGEDTLKNMEYDTESNLSHKTRNLHKIKLIEDENSISFNSKQFDTIHFSPDKDSTRTNINTELKDIFNDISLKSHSDKEDSIKYGIPGYLRNDYNDEEYLRTDDTSSDMDTTGYNLAIGSQLIEMVSDESNPISVNKNEKEMNKPMSQMSTSLTQKSKNKKEQNKPLSQMSNSSTQRSFRIEQMIQNVWKELN